MTVTDNFNRADAATLGSNWTELNNGGKIVSNTARGDAGSYTYQWVLWSANTWNGDHSSQCVVGGSGGTPVWDEGPIVRAADSGGIDGYYSMNHSSSLRRIYRRDNGSFTLLRNDDGTVAVGDTVKLTVTGTTLEHFRNGSSLGTTTDATYSSGSAGISMSSVDANAYVDDWEGTGEVAAGGSGKPWNYYAQN
jgi:hypothetical protein